MLSVNTARSAIEKVTPQHRWIAAFVLFSSVFGLSAWCPNLAGAFQAVGGFLLAIIAIWKDEVTALLHPVRATLELRPVHPENERDQVGNCNAYHLEASASDSRGLVNATVSYRRYKDGADQKVIEGVVHRYFPWSPSEHKERTKTFRGSACCDLGSFYVESAHRYFKLDDKLKTGGALKDEIHAGETKWIWVILAADNLPESVERILKIHVDHDGNPHVNIILHSQIPS